MKKILSIVLTVALMLTVLPFGLFSISTAAATPQVIYKTTNYDSYNQENIATISKVTVSSGKLTITYNITKHGGGSYDSFANETIFYGSNNNIISISQSMYQSDIATKVGKTFIDTIYIPSGTTSILINDFGTSVSYKVSSNHGNPKVEVDVPQICYDDYNQENIIEILSYNVYDGKLFFTYRINEHGGGSYDSFTSDTVFYDKNNNILDFRQTFYTTDIGNKVGKVFFDYMYIPDDTVKIKVNCNTSNFAYEVSQNHGNSSIQCDIPILCHDDYGADNSVLIKSYNIVENKIYFTGVVNGYSNSNYDTFSTDIFFYNAQGSLLDDSMLLYTTNLSAKDIGRAYFDYVYIPDGTTKIVVKDNQSISKHTYTSSCDIFCNNCKVKRTVSVKHVFTNEDDKSCNNCNNKRMSGDLTGDDKINSLDGLMLLRYLNGWSVTINKTNQLDVNGDGKVNSLDGLVLTRYLNGWEMELLPPNGTDYEYSGGDSGDDDDDIVDDSDLKSWTALEISILKSKSSAASSDASYVLTYIIQVQVGVENGGSFGKDMANAAATQVKGALSSLISNMNSISNYIKANKDLIFYTQAGERISLKENFNKAYNLAVELYSTPLSGSMMLSAVNAYYEKTMDLHTFTTAFYTVAKNQ